MNLGNDIDLIKDQESRREQNRVYLRSVLKTYFNNAYSDFSKKYETLIAANLLDPSDQKELKLLIKKEFDRLNVAKPYWSEHGSYSYFGCISINNEQFTYNSKELLNSAKELINKIYPLLKDDINTVGFSQWMGSIRNTAEKVYLKKILNPENYPGSTQLQSSETNRANRIFKDNGFEIFKALKEEFPKPNAGVTTKYTLIYDQLRTKFSGSAKEYFEFVKHYCVDEMEGTKFVRFTNLPNYYNEAFKAQLEQIIANYN
ncbi:hypothetical protein ACNKXS_03605 [Christiangramia marina]|uniref:hypothetical protein n=1 Tax=Christiangramia marina TaxID=409436 RepID=UPI003AA81631